MIYSSVFINICNTGEFQWQCCWGPMPCNRQSALIPCTLTQKNGNMLPGSARLHVACLTMRSLHQIHILCFVDVDIAFLLEICS